MRASRIICGIGLAGFAEQTPADTATSHRTRANSHIHVRQTNLVAYRVPSNLFYVPSVYTTYPRTALALNRPAQRSTLIGVPPLVDPSAGAIDRKAWSWRRMTLGIAPAFPAYASDIRAIDSPAVALDGATFLADGVAYRLRGFDAPEPGTPGAEAAHKRLETLLASGERMVVYPIGLDFEQRMLTDAVMGSTDLVALLRAP